MAKTRLNLSLDPDLVAFLKGFAAANRTTAAEVVNQYLLALKRRANHDPAETILADPAFRQAMLLVQKRLRNGKTRWHTYEEVFGD